MPSRVLSLYTTDEITARARYLRDQVDAGATTVNNGLGANAGYISVGQARRLIEELMDELDIRAGRRPPSKTRYTMIEPVSGYGYRWSGPGNNGRGRGRGFWGI